MRISATFCNRRLDCDSFCNNPKIPRNLIQIERKKRRNVAMFRDKSGCVLFFCPGEKKQIEFEAVNYAKLVDLKNSAEVILVFTSSLICFEKSASIQPRTSPPKFVKCSFNVVNSNV